MTAWWDDDVQAILIRVRECPSFDLGPKPHDHPTLGLVCMVCGEPFVAGQETVAVPVGPLDASEAQAAREGQAFVAVGLEIHKSCAAPKAPPS